MRDVEPEELARSIETLEVADDELVETVIMIVKSSSSDGTSGVRMTTTAGASHWEVLGMLLDTLDGLRDVGHLLD